MANAETTKYSDLCRLCCSKTNQMMGIHIFANDGSLRQIDKKIEACLSIQVSVFLRFYFPRREMRFIAGPRGG